MRPKVLLSVVAAASGLLLLLSLLRPGPDARIGAAPTSVESVTRDLPATQVHAPAGSRSSHSRPAAHSGHTTGSGSDSASQAQAERAVESRIADLEELAMADDAGSLGMILSELDNPNPQIRAAALEATIQFGSRDAIPTLQEVAARTDDPEAKGALEHAIAYLTLPSLTEVLAERRGAAVRQ
jgi:HEAT repeats